MITCIECGKTMTREEYAYGHDCEVGTDDTEFAEVDVYDDRGDRPGEY